MSWVRINRICIKAILLLGLVCVLPQSVLAASVSLTGNFSHDDDIQLIDFSIDAPSDVMITTLSYAGGMNAAGQSIASGGFDPVVSLFDDGGVFLTDNDDGLVPSDSTSGNAFDSSLQTSLASGNYVVALTQFDNLAFGPLLSDGFSQEGITDFTDFWGCSNGLFCDADGNNRSSAWALDIHWTASQQPVPEPSTAILMSTGLLGLGWWRWKHS